MFQGPLARELSKNEFPLAEKVWLEYRQQKADPVADRIFGVFVEGKCVGVARCKRHADGFEVDGVFVLEEYRGRHLADLVVGELVKACGHEVLFMHSTLALVNFYKKFGWRPIPETQLPPTIKERLIFCLGEMEGCNAVPMRREPTRSYPDI
jgi:N-acetylglutamate synthase-like GNAT family acetyltransferase